MFCPKCGKQNPDTSKFCSGCGSALTPAQTAQPAQAAPAPVPQPPKAEKPKKEKKVKTKKPYDGKLRILAPIISILVSISLIAGSTLLLVWDSIAFASETPAAEGEGEGENKPEPAVVEFDIDAIVKKGDKQEIEDSDADEEDIAQMESDITSIEAKITEAESALAEEYPVIDSENLDDYVWEMAQAADDWMDEGLIYNYDYSDTCVRLELNHGGNYVIAPTIDKCDAGADAEGEFELKIATYQPCRSGYSSALKTYMEYVDDGAELICDELDKYTFADEDNIDNLDVTPESAIGFSKCNVVFWHGHGAYDNEYGGLMLLGIKRNPVNNKKYYDLIQQNAIFVVNSGYLIGAEFFNLTLSDDALDNTVLYMGTCSSGRDSRLADALLAKGAEAVYVNSGTIHTTYNLKMMKAVAEGLVQTDSTGAYNTVVEALDYAKNKISEYDTGDLSSTRVDIYTNNENFALDWYVDHVITERSVMLVLDNSGSMDGDPIVETKEASLNFIESVTEQNASVGIVSFSDGASVLSDFTMRQSSLNAAVDNMGAYGGTNIYAGLELAEQMLETCSSEKKIIVLMSDGLPNAGLMGDELIEYANTLKDEGIYIYTLGFFNALGGGDLTNAQALMEGIATTGCHYEIDDADSIVYFFEDVASHISGQKYIYIRIACPVDVKITFNGETLNSSEKDLSTRTSFGTISFENIENDDEDSETNSEESEEDNQAKIVRLLDGADYDIELVGTDKGKMNYTIGYMDEEGEYSDMREFKRVPITDDTIITTSTGAEKNTVLEVDEDGDGRVDFEYEAEKNGNGEIVTYTFEYILLGVIAAATISLVVSIIVMVHRIKRHSAWKKSLAAA